MKAINTSAVTVFAKCAGFADFGAIYSKTVRNADAVNNAALAWLETFKDSEGNRFCPEGIAFAELTSKDVLPSVRDLIVSGIATDIVTTRQPTFYEFDKAKRSWSKCTTGNKGQVTVTPQQLLNLDAIVSILNNQGEDGRDSLKKAIMADREALAKLARNTYMRLFKVYRDKMNEARRADRKADKAEKADKSPSEKLSEKLQQALTFCQSINEPDFDVVAMVSKINALIASLDSAE